MQFIKKNRLHFILQYVYLHVLTQESTGNIR